LPGSLPAIRAAVAGAPNTARRLLIDAIVRLLGLLLGV
jgi:hypothetical protein